MGADLRVNGQNIRSGLRESLDILIRIVYHQMDVEYHHRFPADGLDDRDTQGIIRDKMSVHHVDMQVLRACLLYLPYILAKCREIGGQDGRSQLVHHN